MASDNKELNIGIKVTSDTAGAKQATAAIDGVDKAVADLAKTEKEAINANGMYLESLGRIHDASGRFVKVAAEEREGLKERIKIQEQETGVVNRATVTTNGAAEAKKILTQAEKDAAKASTQSAMGFMALSNAIQDVQFGFGGLINNIPGIVSGMGLGMGVAGAAQIAGVAFGALIKNVDIFGEKAKQAARDAADLTAEMMADADAAYKNAEATKAATEAQDRHNEAMQAAEEQYKEQIKLSEDLLRQKQAERDAVIAMTDAQAGLDMAKIQLAEGRGEMSKEDAIIAKEKVRAEAEARKRAAEVAVEAERVADMDRKARAEVLRGNAILTEAEKLKTEGAGMMTKGDRELAGKNMGSAQAQLEEAKFKQEEAAKSVAHLEGLKSNPMAAMGVYEGLDIDKKLGEAKAELAKQNGEAAKLQADINREDEKIKKDKEARLKTGIKDGDARDLEKAIEEKTKQGKAAYSSAYVIGEDRNEMIRGFEQSQKLFDVRQQTGATQAQVQVEAEQRRRQEEARREEERAAAEKERNDAARAREVAQVGTAGGSLASTLAGDKFPSSFTDSLREASGGAGDAAGLERLIAMVAKLAANSSKLSEQAKSKLDKLEAEIEDLRTAK